MSESALVRSVRDNIRGLPRFTGPPDRTHKVTIEPDEQFPAVAADVHIAVLYGGVQAADTQETNEGAQDLRYGVDVLIALRSPKKPRDRQRELWIDLMTSFEVLQREIDSVVDFKNQIMTDANAFISAETSSIFGFTETLKLFSVGPIRDAPPGMFASGNEGVAAKIRTLQYRGARREVPRT